MASIQQQIYVCSIDEIQAAGCLVFEIPQLSESGQVFLVLNNDRIYAFVNRCPHTGITLNWQPNQFFDITNQLIQCATHCALFRIEDGLCVRGPCVGDKLQQLNIRLTDDQIYLLY